MKFMIFVALIGLQSATSTTMEFANSTNSILSLQQVVFSSPPVIITPLNNLHDMFTYGNGFLECAMGGLRNHPPGCMPTNSTTQAKFLGKINSSEKCAHACFTFTYRGIFPCRSYTYFHSNYGNTSKQKGWRNLCYARIDNTWIGEKNFSDGNVTSGLRTDLPDCFTAMQCELNGKCINSKCICSQGWRGRFCQTLDLLPAKRGNGYHRKNMTSWGGSIIAPEISGLSRYQLIVAEFDLHCGFNAWYEVSRIIRASSSTADGPYVFEEVIKQRFAHGPTVVQAPDGRFVLFHIGDGLEGSVTPGLHSCRNGTTPAGIMPKPSYTDCGKPKQVKARLLMSDSILGPWVNDTVLGCGDENVAPYIFADGSSMYLNRYGSLVETNNCTACPGPMGELYRANAKHWTGPYTFVPHQLFPGCGDPCVEDSNVYTIQNPPNASGKYANTNVGSFHSLFHGRTHQYRGPGNGQMPEWSGRHAWSNDSKGEVWFMSPYAAFSSKVEWQGGGSSTFSTRERPHVLWQNGLMTHLLSGVESGAANCLDCSERGRNRVDDYAYTFVQPINTKP